MVWAVLRAQAVPAGWHSSVTRDSCALPPGKYPQQSNAKVEAHFSSETPLPSDQVCLMGEGFQWVSGGLCLPALCPKAARSDPHLSPSQRDFVCLTSPGQRMNSQPVYQERMLCVAAPSDCKPSNMAVITPQKNMAYIPAICPIIHVILFLQLLFPLLKTLDLFLDRCISSLAATHLTKLHFCLPE